METKVNEIIFQARLDELMYNQELINKVNDAIVIAETSIEENDWQVKGDIELLKKFSMSQYQQLSKSEMKRLNRYSNWVIERPNLNNINRFFHSLCTRIFKTAKRVKVLPSVRELEIQESRKRWKDVQKVEQELLKRYKEVKGDFYKNKL